MLPDLLLLAGWDKPLIAFSGYVTRGEDIAQNMLGAKFNRQGPA